MTYATNKRARFDYEILETVEAGLMLSGQEVKSVRNGGAKLLGSFVTFHNNAAFLLNSHISKYRYAGKLENYIPDRSRKLLLTHKQIAYLEGKSHEAGLTIIPLSIYTKGPYLKVEIGVARGKKKFDKREKIKKREVQRERLRYLKNG